MNTAISNLTRRQLIQLRRNHVEFRSKLLRRQMYWQQFVRASAALAREYTWDDSVDGVRMSKLNFAALERERGTVRDIEHINQEISSIDFKLRQSDFNMTAKQLFDEQAEIEVNTDNA